jgi:hypothetical protein
MSIQCYWSRRIQVCSNKGETNNLTPLVTLPLLSLPMLTQKAMTLRPIFRWLTLSLFLMLGMLYASPAHATPGDEFNVYVLTFGPGDHPFFKFGHNAIWVNDKRSRRNEVYNYGTFAFGPTLIPKFLKGRLDYWLSVQSLFGTLQAYKAENRSVTAQELNLTAEQKLQLVRSLRLNALDENKYYKYHYYKDNCSTRVRDAVDKVIDGKLRAVSKDPASMSWRAHTRRLTADDIPIYLGLHVAMGNVIDQPTTVWEEMFLPFKVQETLRKVKVTNSNGQEIPLVKSERLLVKDQRDPLRTQAPNRTLPMLLVGALLGGLWYGLSQLASKNKGARITLGVLLSIFGLFFGFLCSIFLMFWFFTDHEVAYHNENILQMFPVILGLTVTGIGLARNKPKAFEQTFRIVTLAAACSALGIVLKILPWFSQNNTEFIAFFLPFWGGASAGLYRVRSTWLSPSETIPAKPRSSETRSTDADTEIGTPSKALEDQQEPSEESTTEEKLPVC